MQLVLAMLKRRHIVSVRYGLLFLFVVVFLLTGCASIYKKPAITRKAPRGHKGERVDAKKVVSYLENQPELKSFKAKGKISIRTSKWSGSGRVFIAGVYPTKLHFEVFDFFGNPKWVINATRDRVEAMNVATKELFVSRNTRDLMDGLFAIPADLDEIFFFFTGQRPPVNWSSARLSPVGSEPYLLLEATNHSLDNWLLFLNVANLSIEKTVIWHRADHTRLRIIFDDYQYLNSYNVPFTRILAVRDAEMKIIYKNFNVNQTCNDGLFQIKRPLNARIIRVGFLNPLR